MAYLYMEKGRLTLLLAAVLVAGVPADDAVYRASLEFGVDHAHLDTLSFCESTRNPLAVGDGGRARGLMQFHLRTFERWAGELGYVGDVRTDPVASARAAALKVSTEGTYRQGWSVCSEKYGLP